MLLLLFTSVPIVPNIKGNASASDTGVYGASAIDTQVGMATATDAGVGSATAITS